MTRSVAKALQGKVLRVSISDEKGSPRRTWKK